MRRTTLYPLVAGVAGLVVGFLIGLPIDPYGRLATGPIEHDPSGDEWTAEDLSIPGQYAVTSVLYFPHLSPARRYCVSYRVTAKPFDGLTDNETFSAAGMNPTNVKRKIGDTIKQGFAAYDLVASLRK